MNVHPYRMLLFFWGNSRNFDTHFRPVDPVVAGSSPVALVNLKHLEIAGSAFSRYFRPPLPKAAAIRLRDSTLPEVKYRSVPSAVRRPRDRDHRKAGASGYAFYYSAS